MTEAPTQHPNALPPIGEVIGSSFAGKAVELIYSRRAAIARKLSMPLGLAKACRNIASWGQDISNPRLNECKTVVHKIRLAIETQVANHLKEPAKVTIEPIETGEYAKWYWCGPPEAAAEIPIPMQATDELGQPLVDEMGQPAVMIQPGLDPIYVGAVMPSGEVVPPQPLPTQLAKLIRDMAQADPETVDPQWICKLNDEYTAKTIQKQFDADWRQAKADKWLRSRVYANAIEGWQLPLYEFDTETMQHLLRRNSIDQTYIDQSVEDIDDAVEAGIDLYLDMDEAIALYPQHEAVIRDKAAITSMFAPGTAGIVPIQYSGTFERPMITKIVWWLRNQPINVPMTEQEAVDGGHVQAIPTAPLGPDTIPEPGMPVAPGLAADDAGGELQIPPEIPPVAQFTLAGESALAADPVTPDHPSWPKKLQLALRQISIIADQIVEDIVCPFPDIPILHMRNTMVVGQPWGIGEPFNTKNLQDAYSSITTDAIEHTRYVAHPACEMHKGLADHMKKEYGRAFLDPSMVLEVPNEYWRPGDPNIRVIEPPAFPASSMGIRAAIGEDFNEVAGRPDVLSGTSPNPQDSGRKIDSLTANAVEPLNFKAQEIAFLVEKLANLMLYSILAFRPRSEIAMLTSVPEPLLELVLQRAKSRTPNIKVTISTGAGSVIERKRAQYLQLGQMIDPMDGTPYASGVTVREMAGLDGARESRRNQESARSRAMILAPMQQAAGGEDEQGREKETSGKSNGNGRMK